VAWGSYWMVITLFLALGITGSILYFKSHDCEMLSAVSYRWTFAGVLAFLITCGLMFSSIFGKIGAPFFALLGMLLGNLFQALADFFKGIASVLTKEGDPNNRPPKRSASGEFSLYVNHAALLWFFAYILQQDYDERYDPCDKPLHKCLTVFSIYGLFMTYCNFLFEKFAGVQTRQMISGHMRFLWIINIVAYIAWGIFTSVSVLQADTCKDTAKDVYRLSFLLSCVFLVFCAVLALGLCAGILDFLCSGRVRFVVVVETGDKEDEDDA